MLSFAYKPNGLCRSRSGGEIEIRNNVKVMKGVRSVEVRHGAVHDKTNKLIEVAFYQPSAKFFYSMYVADFRHTSAT